MLPLLLYAIASASRPDSTTRLAPEHIKRFANRPPPYRKPIIHQKVRKWRGIFEHKDTPLHKS